MNRSRILDVLENHPVEAQAAQNEFYRAIEKYAPEVLQHLYESVGFSSTDSVRDSALQLWAEKFVLTNEDGRISPTIKTDAICTLAWWRRRKPSPEQVLSAQDGSGAVPPFEWFYSHNIVRAPEIIPEGQRSVFEISLPVVRWEPSNEPYRAARRRIRRFVSSELDRRLDEIKLNSEQLEARKITIRSALHAEWAVLFQIKKMPVRGIAGRCSLPDLRTIRSGIKEVLALVGIQPRRDRAGRPSKN